MTNSLPQHWTVVYLVEHRREGLQLPSLPEYTERLKCMNFGPAVRTSDGRIKASFASGGGGCPEKTNYLQDIPRVFLGAIAAMCLTI